MKTPRQRLEHWHTQCVSAGVSPESIFSIAEDACDDLDEARKEMATLQEMMKLEEPMALVAQYKRERDEAREQVRVLRETGVSVTASLVAAISLLERGGKQAAPSDKMFYQMLDDYHSAVKEFRETFAATEPRP